MSRAAWPLLSALLFSVPAGAGAVSVSVEVEMCRGCAASGSLEAQVTLRRPDSAVEAPTKTIRVPGTATFEVEGGAGWTASVAAPGFWSRPGVVVPTGPETHLELWPAGRVEGELAAAPGMIVPESLTARFEAVPGASTPLPRASVVCPVLQRRFRCDVPAGLLDLRLRARGFISQYRWGVKVPARRALDVGVLDLRPGASLVGWVQVPGREKAEDCRVELRPQAAGSASSPTDEARHGRIRQAAVSSRGFFELDGMAPGSYRLTVQHPHLATATVGPLGVLFGSETEVDPIRLQPPIRLEAHLHPATDPYGSRWTVDLLREGAAPGSSESVATSTASAEGVWRAPGLSPGHYFLRVAGSHNARWAYQALEAVPGMAPVEVDLPVVQVEGEVRLGKEPLEALIWFGGQNGARRIAARSQVDGRFSVALPPQQAPWYVEIYNQPRAVTARFFDVDVRKSADQPVARVRFELPDTLVKGRVVDENEQPVPGAFVDAFGSAGPLDQAKSRSAGEKAAVPGEFEFRGLRPGTWRLMADAAGGTAGLVSDPRSVELTAGRAEEDLRLVLRRRIELSGEIVDPSGQPVAGADVEGLPELASGPYIGWQPHATTDSAGTFTLQLPDSTTAVELTLLAPGFAVRQLRVDPRNTEPLVLTVEQVAGTLVLLYPEAPEKGDPSPVVRRLRTTLFHDYRIPIDLANWAYLQGVAESVPERFVVPMLEPGHYVACRAAGDAPLGAEVAAALAGSCASGDLTPQGELVLQLPKPDRSSAAP